MNDFEAQQSISFDILQIGENVNKLSEETKQKYNKIQWNKVVGMRNFVAHDYISIDTLVVFTTAKKEIPILKKYCKSILNN